MNLSNIMTLNVTHVHTHVHVHWHLLMFTDASVILSYSQWLTDVYWHLKSTDVHWHISGSHWCFHPSDSMLMNYSNPWHVELLNWNRFCFTHFFSRHDGVHSMFTCDDMIQKYLIYDLINLIDDRGLKNIVTTPIWHRN